jgi:hypothetical protein
VDGAFHLIEVNKVLVGLDGDASIQAVELRMITSGENFVSGGFIQTYDASGSAVATLGTFTADLPASGALPDRKILCATTAFQTTFGITADLTISPGLAVGTGQVAFEKIGCPVNAVPYGSVTVPKFGTSAALALPNDLAYALVRVVSNSTFPSCPMAEDAAARIELRNGNTTTPIPFTNNAGASVNVFSTVTEVDVAGSASRPPTVRAAPNPFAGVTELRFTGAPGRVAIHDVSGRLVREWAGLRWSSSGSVAPRMAWDGRDRAGRPVPSGIYFVRAETARGSADARIVLLR